MSLTKTCDENIFIESQTPTSVIYVLPRLKLRWRIDGVCNKCGRCWAGAVNPPPPADLDCPVAPELKKKIPECTLSGEYLEYR